MTAQFTAAVKANYCFWLNKISTQSKQFSCTRHPVYWRPFQTDNGTNVCYLDLYSKPISTQIFISAGTHGLDISLTDKQ